MRGLAAPTALVLAALAAPRVARAAPPQLPPDDAYVPWHCAGAVMTDAQGDDPAFLGNLDVVGETTAPAALRAADDTYLYLRIRLDADPAPGGQPAQASWGVELDLDGDPTTYELLVLAEGITSSSGTVSVFTNKTVTKPDAPDDPADTPAALTYPFADHARSTATSTTNGGTPDYFLDLALPWSDLKPLGLARDTRTRVWVASSNLTDGLNGDFACFTGDGGNFKLDGGASDQTTSDPNQSGGGGGGGGSGGGNTGPRLEGGGGCDAGGGGGLGGLAPFALALALIARRRARR